MLDAIRSGVNSFINQAYSTISGLLGKREVVDMTDYRDEWEGLSKTNDVFDNTPKPSSYGNSDWRDHVRLNSDYYHQALQKLPDGPLKAGEYIIDMGLGNKEKIILGSDVNSKEDVIKHFIENGTLDKQAIQDGIDAREWNKRISEMPLNTPMSVDEIWKGHKETARKTNSLVDNLRDAFSSFKEYVSQKLHLTSAIKV